MKQRKSNVIREDSFSCLRTDMAVCDENDVKLSTIVITDKQKLPSYAKNWYAWKSDGGTTDKTCGEII